MIARSFILTVKGISGTTRYSIKSVLGNERISGNKERWNKLPLRMSRCFFYSIIVLSHPRSNKFYRCLIWFLPLSKVWESRDNSIFAPILLVSTDKYHLTKKFHRQPPVLVGFIVLPLTYILWLVCSENCACWMCVIYQLALINCEPDDCLSEPFLHLLCSSHRTAMKSARFVSHFHADI